jgi:N-acetylglutamate synthase-like GNAT family acetyltransferase
MDLTKLLIKDIKKEVVKESQKEQYLDERMLELTNIAVKEANSNSGKSFNLKQFLYDKVKCKLYIKFFY